MKSKKNVLRILALVAVVTISLMLLFGRKLGAFQHDHSEQDNSPRTAATSKRRAQDSLLV